MEIQETIEGAVTVIKPLGALASGDAEQFGQAVRSALSRSLGRFVVDATAVPYFDSRGLETVADLGEELSKAGMMLRVCGANETVRESLDLTELSGFVEHFADVHAGVRSFLS